MKGFESFLGQLVETTARVVARAAVSEGRRQPLPWVVDLFFLALVRELEEAGLPRRVVADMLGISRRTLQRRVVAAEEGVRVRRRSVWMRVYDAVETEPVGLEQLPLRVRAVERKTLASVVQDMCGAGWLRDRNGRLEVVPRTSLAAEQVAELALHLQRVGVAFSVASLAAEYGVDAAVVEMALAEHPAFHWRADETNQWLALEQVVVGVGRFLEARLRGEETWSSGGAWTIFLTDKSPEAEGRLRELVATSIEQLQAGAAAEATPGMPFDPARDRRWSALVLEAVDPRPG